MFAPAKRKKAKRRRRIPAKATRRWHVELEEARRDPIVFIEYVFGIKLDDVQKSWVRFWMRHRKTVLHGSIGLGKSLLMRGMALWFMGRDPGVQIIWLSATQRQPKKHLSLIATLIESDGARSRLHHVFPRLKPGNTWRSTELTVAREVDPLEADYTVSVYGAYSDSLLGSRATILIVDDLCNFSNTLTEDGRSKMIEWLATVLSRLTTPDYRMMVIGNFWHKQDATMDLHRAKGFEYMKTPAFVRDEAGEMIPTAPAAMPVPTIIEKIKELGPRRAKQMLECEAADTNLGRFKDIYFARALELGRRLPFRPKREYEPCFTGIDLGSGKAPGSDRTAMVTVKLRADGKRQVVDVRSGCWGSDEIKRNLREVKRRYNTTIAVENNGIQKLVIDFLREATVIPLKDHNTNAVNKRDMAYGVEGLATEMSEGLWVFPCGDAATFDPRSGMTEDEDSEPHEELQAMIGEALTFDPTKPREHTGDRLMAWWICVSVMWKSALFELDEMELDLDAPTHNIFDR